MQPELVVVSGPLSGQRWTLADGETSVGRTSDNEVAVGDPSVSRRHCLVIREGGRVLIRDLGSHNGTFVNGVPTREQVLSSGDRIDIGDTGLVFRTEAGAGSSGLRPETGRVGLTRFDMRSPLAVESAALLKLTTALVLLENIYTSRGEPAHRLLARQFFELMFDLVASDRGALLLVQDGESEALCSWDASTGAEFEPDRDAVVDCIEAGEPVSTMSDGAVLLSIPMQLSGLCSGVLMLSSSQPGREYLEREVQLLTAVTSIIALGLNHAREKAFLQAENLELRSERELELEHDMIGESPRMRRLYHIVSRVAAGNTTVLIRGESGTGKELVARAIHRNSSRAKMPFVAINCAAVTETLLESEFFGHEKGAFTGATAQKKGKLELANGGTVFLDEIGELAPALQAKLLRVLQEQEFERVGGTRTIQVDIRVVAATNRDLEAAMREGSFRADLFYRLNVLAVDMPSLRQRREDIPLLAAHFAQRFARRAGRHVRGLSERARGALLAYDWPGNVRELENAIERAIVLGSTELILAEDLPEAIVEAHPAKEEMGSFHEAVREAKRRLIISALEQAGWNVTEAAKLLDLHPNYLHRLISQFDLRRKAQT